MQRLILVLLTLKQILTWVQKWCKIKVLSELRKKVTVTLVKYGQ